jgi:hypothetical protein
MSDENNRRYRNPMSEDASREDIIECFGEAAYWRSEVKRLTVRDARLTDLREKRNNRLMLLNAQTQLGLHEK